MPSLLQLKSPCPSTYLPKCYINTLMEVRVVYWPAGHAAHEDDGAEKKEPAGHEASDAVDAGAVVRGDESGADVAVVAAAVVAAAAADVTSGIAAVVPGAAAAVLMAAVVVAANDVVPGPTVVPNAPLYKSTALESPPAVTLMRRQPPAPHTQQNSNNHTSHTSITHAQQLQHRPSVTQRKSCNYLYRPPQRGPRFQQMSPQDNYAQH